MRAHDRDAAVEVDANHPTGRRDPGERGAPTLARLRAGRAEVARVQGVAQLQAQAGNRSVNRLVHEEQDPAGTVDDAVTGPGRALDPGIQRTMERELGADLSSVRVRTGEAAHRSATSLHANAYTIGDDIVFREGRYDPGSRAGQHLLAHELTHVVQQRRGPVDGAPMGDTGMSVSDPADRFERAAEQAADRVVADGPVQRQAAEEEEELQM